MRKQQLNVQRFDDQVRKQVLSSIRRIVTGEAATSDAPKPLEITALPGEFPLTVNDGEAMLAASGAWLTAPGAR